MMLSKTDFLLFLEAPMHLWAKAHDQLETELPSPYEQHLIQQGDQVEILAQNYIEQVILPKYQDGKVSFQKTFDDGQFMCRTDALVWDRTANAYDLYEIKSSTSVRTEHEYDLTFQVLLLENILNIRHAYLLHIDKDYQQGQDFDLENFFTWDELSEKIEKRRDFVAEARKIALAVMHMPVPQSDLACHKPKSCPCPSLCHPNLPPNPIYELPYLGKKASRLREMGITAIKDIPDTFELNPRQTKHRQAVKQEKPVVDLPALKESLEKLDYPLHFLDYETFNPALPLFPGYHPYEHIVFQYVLYVLERPTAAPQLHECLLTAPQDPAPEIVPHLLSHIGSQGSIIVWNQSFEEHRNLVMARRCPTYAEQLLGVNARLYDLMKVFQDGCYVHPDFHGSASLKAVLPVICPDLSYANLEIQNGEDAMLNWYRLQTGQTEPEDRMAVEDAMKAYCRMDTFGMVEILVQLQRMIGD